MGPQKKVLGVMVHTIGEQKVDDLLPKLSSKTVIVMDNAAFHKVKSIQDAIKSAGHTILFLPPYSPDLNPIEHIAIHGPTLNLFVKNQDIQFMTFLNKISLSIHFDFAILPWRLKKPFQMLLC